LSPSESSLANRFPFEIPLPSKASSVAFDGKRARLIVVHTSDDLIYAFSVPIMSGKVPWPDGLGWDRLDSCEAFGVFPDPQNLSPSSVIRCSGNRDSNQSDVDWDLSGRVLTLGSFGKTQLPIVSTELAGQILRVSTWDRS